MKTMVFYEDNGRITGVRSGDEESINAEIELHKDEQFILTEKAPDYINYYVESGDVFRKPDQQSKYQEFNYQTKQWEFSLDYSRNLKWDEIKAARTAQEFDSFEWGGYVFQCDEVSQRRIQGAVQLAMLDSTLTLDWTLADNTVQTFTAAEFESIGQELAAHVSQCHERGRILRQEIDAATSEQDLEAISW